MKRRIAKKRLTGKRLGCGVMWFALSTGQATIAVQTIVRTPKWWPFDWREDPDGRPFWLRRVFRYGRVDETCSICHHGKGPDCHLWGCKDPCPACPNRWLT